MTRHLMDFSGSDPAQLVRIMTETYARPLQAAVRETVSNAVDAVARTGRIPVDGDITVSFEERGDGRTWLSVEDRGCGMSEEDLVRRFLSYANSDKGGDDGQVGSFGLGAKAPLAYTGELEVETRPSMAAPSILSRCSFDGSVASYDDPCEGSRLDHVGTVVSFPLASPDDRQRAVDTAAAMDDVMALCGTGSIAIDDPDASSWRHDRHPWHEVGSEGGVKVLLATSSGRCAAFGSVCDRGVYRESGSPRTAPGSFSTVAFVSTGVWLYPIDGKPWDLHLPSEALVALVPPSAVSFVPSRDAVVSDSVRDVMGSVVSCVRRRALAEDGLLSLANEAARARNASGFTAFNGGIDSSIGASINEDGTATATVTIGTGPDQGWHRVPFDWRKVEVAGGLDWDGLLDTSAALMARFRVGADGKARAMGKCCAVTTTGGPSVAARISLGHAWGSVIALSRHTLSERFSGTVNLNKDEVQGINYTAGRDARGDRDVACEAPVGIWGACAKAMGLPRDDRLGCVLLIDCKGRDLDAVQKRLGRWVSEASPAGCVCAAILATDGFDDADEAAVRATCHGTKWRPLTVKALGAGAVEDLDRRCRAKDRAQAAARRKAGRRIEDLPGAVSNALSNAAIWTKKGPCQISNDRARVKAENLKGAVVLCLYGAAPERAVRLKAAEALGLIDDGATSVVVTPAASTSKRAMEAMRELGAREILVEGDGWGTFEVSVVKYGTSTAVWDGPLDPHVASCVTAAMERRLSLERARSLLATLGVDVPDDHLIACAERLSWSTFDGVPDFDEEIPERRRRAIEDDLDDVRVSAKQVRADSGAAFEVAASAWDAVKTAHDIRFQSRGSRYSVYYRLDEVLDARVSLGEILGVKDMMGAWNSGVSIDDVVGPM